MERTTQFGTRTPFIRLLRSIRSVDYRRPDGFATLGNGRRPPMFGGELFERVGIYIYIYTDNPKGRFRQTAGQIFDNNDAMVHSRRNGDHRPAVLSVDLNE